MHPKKVHLVTDQEPPITNSKKFHIAKRSLDSKNRSNLLKGKKSNGMNDKIFINRRPKDTVSN